MQTSFSHLLFFIILKINGHLINYISDKYIQLQGTYYPATRASIHRDLFSEAGTAELVQQLPGALRIHTLPLLNRHHPVAFSPRFVALFSPMTAVTSASFYVEKRGAWCGGRYL